MGTKITMQQDGTLAVGDDPIIPFVEGDGIGVDIWPAARTVLDAAAAKYSKRVEWLEVLAGEKAYSETGDWLPADTITAFEEYLIGIKGPLTTPVGRRLPQPSTWPSVRSWIFTCACVRCGGSAAFPHRCANRNLWTW